MATVAEMRLAAKQQGIELEECRSYPIRFLDGTTVFMQPENMRLVNGHPVFEHEKYLRKYHPERVDEFLRYKNRNETLHNQTRAQMRKISK